MNKVLIAEGQLNGGLNELQQVYHINFMPEETIEGKFYTDKIELAIMLEKEGLSKGAYRSIRFVSTPQLKGIIMGLIRAYFFFAKQKKEITPKNYNYKKDKFLVDITNALRG